MKNPKLLNQLLRGPDFFLTYFLRKTDKGCWFFNVTDYQDIFSLHTSSVFALKYFTAGILIVMIWKIPAFSIQIQIWKTWYFPNIPLNDDTFTFTLIPSSKTNPKPTPAGPRISWQVQAPHTACGTCRCWRGRWRTRPCQAASTCKGELLNVKYGCPNFDTLLKVKRMLQIVNNWRADVLLSHWRVLWLCSEIGECKNSPPGWKCCLRHFLSLSLAAIWQTESSPASKRLSEGTPGKVEAGCVCT